MEKRARQIYKIKNLQDISLEELIVQLNAVHLQSPNPNMEQLSAQLNALKLQMDQMQQTLAQNEIKPIQDTGPVAYLQPTTVAQLKEHLDTDIKNLPHFTGCGCPSLNEWLTDIDPLMKNLERLIKDTSDYHYYLREVRRKISGEAGAMLTNYGIPLKWENIKDALKNHFGDKRSLTILEREAVALKQDRETLETYYDRANLLLTNTIDAIKLSIEIGEEAVPSHMNLARKRILTCFINGLDGKYEFSCRAMRPKTLNEAFKICVELRNVSQMKVMASNAKLGATAPRLMQRPQQNFKHFSKNRQMPTSSNPHFLHVPNFNPQVSHANYNIPPNFNSQPLQPI
jgi:hypothetical protein